MRTSDVVRTLLTPPAVLAVFIFSVAATGAQMPPPLAPPMVPHPNPSTSLTVPQAPEVPVSPVTPGTMPGSAGIAPGDSVTGTNEVVNPPHSVLAPAAGKHRHRNRHYARHSSPQ